MRLNFLRSQGSILVWTVMTITILSLLGAEVIRLVSLKYQSALQTATWQEALLAAESGIDLGIVELRKSLFPGDNHAWEGWNSAPVNGAVSYGKTVIPNAGLAGTQMTIEVNVDAPTSFVDPKNGWQYYRIRTIGTMPITGSPSTADNKQDNRLRKLSLRWERFTDGTLLSRSFKEGEGPHVSRRVEAIVRPVSSFNQAIMSVGTIDLTNQNIVVDSYDSTDWTKSTPDPKGPDGILHTADDPPDPKGADGILGTADDPPGPKGPDGKLGTADDLPPGLYDVTKRQQNGDIATDGNLIDAGNAHIYGDVATNSGTVTGAANITGTERDDFYQEPIPVGAPSWTSFNSTVTSASNTTSIAAGNISGSSVTRYQLNAISLNGGQTLTLAGNPDGSPTYVEIYVTGDISFTGNAQLIIEPGVTAKIYFQGNVDIGGNGILNTKNQPSDLQLFGIQPTDNISRHVSLGGNGQIVAAVYAPNHDVTINGGGSNGHVFGSVVGKSVTMTGVTNLHYDEMLGTIGKINSYKIVSWFEDNR